MKTCGPLSTSVLFDEYQIVNISDILITDVIPGRSLECASLPIVYYQRKVRKRRFIKCSLKY